MYKSGKIGYFFLHIILLCIFSAGNLIGQNASPCGTEKLADLNRQKKAAFSSDIKSNKPDYRIFSSKRLTETLDENNVLLQIPVVVHVVHNDLSFSPNPNQSSHISVEQVISQIKVLNEDFRKRINTNGFNNNPIGADIGIEFCLASTDPNGLSSIGINYIYNDRKAWKVANLEDDAELKALSYWPSDKYLNIWVTNLEIKNGFGYSHYPFGSGLQDFDPDVDYGAELDGIVIDYRVFGTTGAAVYPYNLGRTTTHEVGHWLGLRHIWGDDNCGDDFVSDTPTDQSPNKDLDCSDSSFCNGSHVQDMTNNYLDYSPDRCMNIFTNGQKERMIKSLFNSPRRKALFESQGCSGLIKNLIFKIFPNPAMDILTLELYWPGHQLIKLNGINSQGALVLDMDIEATNQIRFPVDVSQWPQGLYFFKIKNKGAIEDNFFETVKVLISH